MDQLTPARLRPRDVLRVGGTGLRTRPLRVFLSALGIAIGIAAMTAVVGISSSSGADLDRQLAALGTNLLTVEPGTTLTGEAATLPDESVAMISRIAPIERVASTGKVADALVYRTDQVPAAESGGISVRAADQDLLGTVGADLASGSWLNPATARYPVVVLGSAAASQLGIGAGGQVYLGGRWFTVIGTLDPVPLAPELDTAALIGKPAAVTYLEFDGHPTTIYTRSHDSSVAAVRDVLAATANPEAPNEVAVSRPSDALAARQATSRAFTGLMLGLGAVALVVGGVGVANTMVISVLERRAEIGLRRALGATRGQILQQFLAEALLLSALGGIGGVVLGVAVTTVYAGTQSWPVVVPVWATAGGITATILIGAIAGLYPAVRAGHTPPTEALTT
ncbi:ABC transporter permease [Kribbella solani]|uniref:Putative ABC transport system permease protein n=1 Tax=Kribbella solani TaxID=236067 RepID=A0A841DUV4_9ACTN|nr:ABC transporter permease [Kribbella solani]MBB5980057.1 putative ABC transport system permease protein [Kribbella solani]MDX2971309.1 ABC transporter permease [Kribbella solani]MDX3005572.1 ABC transporter permease [Kribbella solani]